jgi:hypothetical protein
MFLITEGNRRHRGHRDEKRLNFFARAQKLESSFFALAKNEKLKAL